MTPRTTVVNAEKHKESKESAIPSAYWSSRHWTQ
uniref:Uncharacterized protein n=1 Tax=Trichinella nativa TaxID=6335 RepID=A0A0V1KIU4_9BILA